MQSINEKFQGLLHQLLGEIWNRLVQEHHMTVSHFESRLVDMDIENMSLRDAIASLQEQAEKAKAEKEEAVQDLTEAGRKPFSSKGDGEDDDDDAPDFANVKSLASQASTYAFNKTKSMMSVSDFFRQVRSNESTMSFKKKKDSDARDNERKELKLQCTKLNSQVQSLKRELQALRIRNITAIGSGSTVGHTPTLSHRHTLATDSFRESALARNLSPTGFELRPVDAPEFAKPSTPRTPITNPVHMSAWEESQDFEHERPLTAAKSLPMSEKRSAASEADELTSSCSGLQTGFTNMLSNAIPDSCRSSDHSIDGMESSMRVLDIWMMQTQRCGTSLNRQTTTLFNDADTVFDDDLSSLAEDYGLGAWVKSCISKLMVSPTTMKHLLWEIVGVLLIIYDAVVIPMLAMKIPESAFTSAVGWLQRIYWTLAIFAAFLTGFVDSKGLIILDPEQVASRYTRSWLALDIALALLDWMELGGNCDGGSETFTCVITYLQVLRIMRILQLMRAREFTGLIIEHIRSESVILIARVMKIMIFMVWATHLIACTWYGIGRLGTSRETSWVHFHDLEYMSLGERYTRSFHAAFALFFGEHTTYGIPRSMIERIFIIWVLFVTFMMSAWFVSSITSAMTRLSIVSGQDTAHFTALSRYLSDNSISRHLANKVTRNAQHAVDEQKRVAPEKNIELLNVISEPLRCELHYEIHSQTLLVHPFFRYYEQLNPAGIRKICHHGIKRMSYSTGDVVFSEGESPSVPRMLFHKAGKLSYCQGDSHLPGSKRRRVSNRNWMCEAVLWTQKWVHRGSLQATSECVLVALDALWFQSIVSKYPTTQVGIYAANFVHDMVSGSPEDITDVGEESPELEFLLSAAFPKNDLHEESLKCKGSTGGRRASELQLVTPNHLGVPGVQREGEGWFNRMLRLVKPDTTRKMAW